MAQCFEMMLRTGKLLYLENRMKRLMLVNDTVSWFVNKLKVFVPKSCCEVNSPLRILCFCVLHAD